MSRRSLAERSPARAEASGLRARAAAALMAAALAGCATASDGFRRYGAGLPPEDKDGLACASYLAEAQARIEASGVRDAEARRVPGFPYLRVDRFLAGIKPTLVRDDGPSPRFKAWAERLGALENEAFAVEVGNLPPPARAELENLARNAWGPAARPVDAARRCGRRLLAADLSRAERRRALLDKATVPYHYSDFSRVFGFYPLMALPVLAGWDRWRAAHLPVFESPPDELPVAGRLVDFVPREAGPRLGAAEVAAMLESGRDPHLGLPMPKPRDLDRLVANFAPVWRVDVTGPFDRIGHPAWASFAGPVTVDVARPTVFTRISHTLLDGEPLLQISYLAWFQERPADGPFDILAGKLDALIWRVTLDRDGTPLIYDTIHACGCYHLFFPAPETRLRRERREPLLQEETAVPARAPAVGADERIVLRIETRSHYLVGLERRREGQGREGEVGYGMTSDGALRALALPGGGTRSLYGPDGLVAGSERLERFLLWPMGIASPGALRQWGHHATAFVGMRHFDDPDLYEPLIAP